MKYIINILILLFHLSVFSQRAFYFQHIQPISTNLFDVVEGKNGYLSVGRSSEEANDKGFLLFLNKYGDLEWEKTIDLETQGVTVSEYRSVTYKSPYFYAIGMAYQGNEEKYLFSKINGEGEILFSKILDTPFQLAMDNFPSKIILDDDILLVAGSGATDTGTKGELLKLDLEGNIIWKQKYSQYPNSVEYYEYIRDIKVSKDGHYLLEIYSVAFSSYDISTIIKIDNNGDEIWRKSYDTIIPSNLTNDTLSFISATPYKNSHVFALFNVANEDQYNYLTYPQRDFALIEYDELGQEINYKRFYNPTAFATADIQTNDLNELFVFASSEFGEIEGYHLGVMKLNLENEIEWREFYKKENPLDTLVQAGPLFEKGMQTSDQGFIMVAYDFYFEFGDAYRNPGVLKLDCIGDTAWNYNSCLSPNFDDVTLFPNPVIDNFTIQIPSIPEQSEINLKIFDISGKLVQELSFKDKNVINIDAIKWSKGIYNCVIYLGDIFLDRKKIIKM